MAALKRDVMEKESEVERLRSESSRQQKEYRDALDQAKESIGHAAAEGASLKSSVQQLEMVKARFGAGGGGRRAHHHHQSVCSINIRCSPRLQTQLEEEQEAHASCQKKVWWASATRERFPSVHLSFYLSHLSLSHTHTTTTATTS